MLLLIYWQPIQSEKIQCMEELAINGGGGQGYGFILYRTHVRPGNKLCLKDRVQDRAIVSGLSHQSGHRFVEISFITFK